VRQIGTTGSFRMANLRRLPVVQSVCRVGKSTDQREALTVDMPTIDRNVSGEEVGTTRKKRVFAHPTSRRTNAAMRITDVDRESHGGPTAPRESCPCRR